MKNCKVHVLDNGKLENDRANQIVFHKLGTKDNHNSPSEWVDVPVYTVLIEHPDGLVLFDTASHPDAMTERWAELNMARTPYFATEEQLLPNALARLGFKPEDLNYVVVSHLHEDHGGCLEMFKNAEIIVHDDEFTQTMKLYGLNKDFGACIKADIAAWLAAGLKWRLIERDEGDVELLEGLTILNFGAGHSFGMLGLLIELERDGNIILASDTVFTRTNYGPPIVFPGLNYDSLGYVRTIKKIWKLAKEKQAQVWFGHDIEQFSELRKAPDGFYQ